MRTHDAKVDNEPVTINVVETEEDLDGFRDFIRGNLACLGVDSETTGLDIYGSQFRCRLVQFGTATEAYVVPVEKGPRFEEDVRLALKGVRRLVLHNAAYDLQVFDVCLGLPMETLWPKVRDTSIIAKLIDPRVKEAGGVGHKLEELTAAYIDADVAANVKTLMVDLAKAHKTTKANVWKKVAFEDPHYQLYSGMDPILAIRLFSELYEGVPQSAMPLVPYEHRVAEVCSYIERTGFLLDVEYAEKLSDRLKFEESVAKEKALSFGCEKVNSGDMVADVLESFGVRIIGRTPGGKRKVDDALLSSLDGEAGEFAQAVIKAKRASSWRTTWVDNFLRTKDSGNRVHPGINPLQARTGRMSITNPATQNLPSNDWMIRRCFIADEGHSVASVDYAAQELRVLAALSKDPTMVQAFRDDADLHLMTARAAFGPHIEKDDKERKWAKVVNFGRVYGGGAKTVADQTGLDFPTAKRVVDGFDRAYPGVQKLSNKLQLEATANGYITTPVGRRLPVDPARAYSALNYLIQSSSRDVTCRALLRLHDAGFTPYVRLPIHDEFLLSVPTSKAKWGADRVAEVMAEQMGPVHISTDAEVGGRSWGSLYMKPDEVEKHDFVCVP